MNFVENRAVKGLYAGGIKFSATIDLPAIAAGAVTHSAETVAGVRVGDIILAAEMNETANVGLCHCAVTDNNEVTVSMIGGTGGGNPASGTFTFYVLRPGQPGPGLS